MSELSPTRKRVAIVGGGPAGLAAAYRLSLDSSIEAVLLERAASFGGLAAGMQRDGMRLDFGPHRLHHATDPGVLSDLRLLLGSELVLRPRRGRILVRGRYLAYPPGPAAALALGPAMTARLALGMLGRRQTGDESTYESAVVGRLGRPLYDLFYGPYAHKVWGLPGSELSADQAERRVNQRGIADFVRLLFRRNRASFYYPVGGFGRITDAYLEAIQRRPNVVLVPNASVDCVWIDDGHVAAVSYALDGVVHRLDVDHLVWSAPVTGLPPVSSAASTEAREAAGRLRYRALVIAYLELPVPSVGSVDTYYFPEAGFPFNRVMEQKQFSAATVPPDRTVLVMDLACDPDDDRFRATDDAIRDLVVSALEIAGLMKDTAPVGFWTKRFRYAYPIYDRSSRGALATLHEWADSIANLWLIGRQGLFLHNNTHHSLLMGYRAGEAISQGWNRERWTKQVEDFASFSVED